MRKLILAAVSTAAAGASLLSADAAQAQGAQGFQLQVGGFYNALAIVRDQDRTAAGDRIRRYDFNQRGRYAITGAQTLDNGLTLGFHTEYEMQDGMNNDRSYVYAEGGFGRLQFGTNWSPIEHMHALSPSAGWAIDDSSHAEGFAGLNGVYPVFTTAYVSDRDMRIAYYSPRVYGFQLGLSYAPDTNNTANMNNRIATRTNTLVTRDIFSAIVNYENSFGDLDLFASLAAETGKRGAAADKTEFTKGRHNAYSAGLQLGYAGFLAGVAYGYDDLGASNYRQHKLGAGLLYTLDELTFGPSFAMGWEKGSASNREKVYVYELGATYAFAPGVDLIGSIQHARFKRGSGTTNNGSGTAGLFGVALSF